MKFFLYKQKMHFIKETDTFGHIVVWKKILIVAIQWISFIFNNKKIYLVSKNSKH